MASSQPSATAGASATAAPPTSTNSSFHQSPSFSSSSPSSSLYSRFHAYPFATDTEYQAGLSSIIGHPGTPTTAAELDAHPGLVLNAKLFYFAQKHNLITSTGNPLDAKGYVDWLRTQTSRSPTSAIATAADGQPQNHDRHENNDSQDNDTKEEKEDEESKEQNGNNDTSNNKIIKSEVQAEQPPYPSSFAAIVDLITSNKPVPGIEQIPDTVLEPGSSKVDRTPRRRKPWEKQSDDGNTTSTGTGTTTNNNNDTSQAQPEEAGTDKPDQTETSAGLLRILQPNAIPSSGLLANTD